MTNFFFVDVGVAVVIIEAQRKNRGEPGEMWASSTGRVVLAWGKGGRREWLKKIDNMYIFYFTYSSCSHYTSVTRSGSYKLKMPLPVS